MPVVFKTISLLLLVAVVPTIATAQPFGKKSLIYGPIAEADREMPLFQLSNARLQKRQDGTTALLFDYRRTRAGKPGAVEVAIRFGESLTAEKMFAGLDQSRASGTYRVRLGDSIEQRLREQGAEIFAMMELLSSRQSGPAGTLHDIRYRFKLSNSITVGRVSGRIETRPATPDELRRADVWRKPKQEIAVPSDEFTFLRDAQRSAPGMRAMLYSSGQWIPGEYVGETDSRWIVIRVDADDLRLESTFASRVAVKKADVDLLARHPDAFTPSIYLVPGLATPLPDGFVVCPKRLPLVPGTPVKARYGRSVVDGFVISEQSGVVDLKYKWIAYHETKVPREHVLLTSRVIEWLQAGDATERFARYLEPENRVTPLEAAAVEVAEKPANSGDQGEPTEDTSPAETVSETASVREVPSQNRVKQRKLKRYPVKLPIPRKMQPLSAAVPLQPGIKLGCSWGSRWYPVTVLQLYSDGAVRVRWDDFGEVWDADLSRDDLIIARRLLRTLDQQAAAPKATPRRWTDQSGKFEVIAFLVAADGDQVQLRKPDGSEISVPIDKLSAVDQTIVDQLVGELP